MHIATCAHPDATATELTLSRACTRHPKDATDHNAMTIEGMGVTHTGLLVRSAVQRGSLPYQLVPRERGTFGCLRPQGVDVRDLGPGEVCLRVEAVGINFRDVLNVLGMYPGDPGLPGADMAGVVVAVGQGAGRLVEGQAVFGLAPGCLGSHVVADEAALAPLPPGASFKQAATMPTVFVTVDMALRAAGASAGDVMLVHGAAGGVGLASVQVAHGMGMVVVATAGSARKRAMLRSMGVRSVYDSRSTAFVEGCVGKGHTCGAVRVAVNSLTSTGLVAASMSVLGRGGSLVELSKRDIWSHARAAMERGDVNHKLLAMDFLPAGVLKSMLEKVSHGMSTGRLAPLPGVVHSMDAVQAALRQMSQARHVGKVIVTCKASEGTPHTPPEDQHACVAVSGGMGMLGTLTAEWLVRRQVPHVLVLGRNVGATPLPDKLTSVAALSLVQCDVSMSSDLVELEQYHADRPPPLVGLMHAGGALADATLPNQTAAAMRAAFAPKMSGAIRCHDVVKGMAMRSLVLFSSTAALLGSPGQSSYAAANSAMDGLAGMWRGMGVAGVSVQWGAWAGGGMALKDAGTVRRLERGGMGLIQPEGIITVTYLRGQHPGCFMLPECLSLLHPDA
eukprot:jgi/Tetstr1/433804/TSEL_002429.t1